MGYLSTMVFILLGMSLAFHIYAGMLTEDTTLQYGMNATVAQNMANQAGAPLGKLQGMGVTSNNTLPSNAITNTIIGSVTGLVLGSAASILAGGGFAMIYIVPAVAIGALVGLVAEPLDAFNMIVQGQMPADVGIFFMSIMMVLFFLTVMSFIFGQDRGG